MLFRNDVRFLKISAHALNHLGRRAGTFGFALLTERINTRDRYF